MIPEEWGKDLADSMPKFRFMVERDGTGAKVFDTLRNRVVATGSSCDMMTLAGELNSVLFERG